jgi:hypothetical protein
LIAPRVKLRSLQCAVLGVLGSGIFVAVPLGSHDLASATQNSSSRPPSHTRNHQVPNNTVRVHEEAPSLTQEEAVGALLELAETEVVLQNPTLVRPTPVNRSLERREVMRNALRTGDFQYVNDAELNVLLNRIENAPAWTTTHRGLTLNLAQIERIAELRRVKGQAVRNEIERRSSGGNS